MLCQFAKLPDGKWQCPVCKRVVPAFAKPPKSSCDPATVIVTQNAGPRCLAGTALKALLSRFGINADERGCKCKSRAAHMDAAGCDWCEANLATIVGWLREEAQRRGLPFIDAAGRMLICRAIRNARRAAKG